jgi:hypothetical protein
MKHLSRICSVAVLLVVFCGSLIIGVFRTQGTLTNFSSANRQHVRWCACKGGTFGVFYFPIPDGYGPEVCPAVCASNGGVGDAKTYSGIVGSSWMAPNHFWGFGDAVCFLREGAAGNCKDNMWCKCGTAFVHALGPDGKTITRTDEAGQVVPAESVAVRLWILHAPLREEHLAQLHIFAKTRLR